MNDGFFNFPLLNNLNFFKVIISFYHYLGNFTSLNFSMFIIDFIAVNWKWTLQYKGLELWFNFF